VPVRVDVSPELLIWARERSTRDPDDLAERFPKLSEWEQGVLAPTLKQLEKFARATRTPIGYLLLREPPEEPLPIADYRTMGDEAIRRPSPDLLDTIFRCQQRQDWYAEYARENGQAALPFVGSLSTDTPVGDAARAMSDALNFNPEQRGSTWANALSILIEQAENLGVLVMVNGVVGNNTRRKLRPTEFRGFTLVHELAPVVFVNGADTKSAQIFTLAHELAHLWIGVSALSDADPGLVSDIAVERWCNQVAAEFLVPLATLRAMFQPGRPLTTEVDRLAARFKVSTLVIIRRLFEADYLSWDEYREAYTAERDRILAILEEDAEGGGGGNFYNTQPIRASRRFSRAIIENTLEGATLYRDAFQLLGIRSVSTFNELATQLRGE
jgi:Zn-dependent peptidase ImmA (M78 family)/transcriptional regulator with XRE-family HTH domain